MPNNLQMATFGAGCFWGVEETFRQLKGVSSTIVGYTGGTLKNPAYQDVCTGQTGHAEAVQITFDPKVVSYEELLKIFFESHNPMTLNSQGPDVGTQYRSAIFFHDKSQQEAAIQHKEKLMKSGRYPREIVTQIVPAAIFYKAEDYHQQYLHKRGLGSCHL